MSKYDVYIPPYAQKFLKSVVRTSATDEMLLVLRSRVGNELIYHASEAPKIIDGLRQFIDFAKLDCRTTKNLREQAEYEAACKGLVDARSQAEKHLRRYLANRPT